MAEQPKFMFITHMVRAAIDERGWLNLSLDQREMLMRGLRSDIAAAKDLKNRMSVEDQRKIGLEIAAAEEMEKGMTAVFVPPNAPST